MKRLISGPVLLGFAEAFDSSHGDDATPKPYPVVVPSAVGPALLPFACPHCGTTCSELVDPNKREDYYDAERKFCWCPCPDCRKRFFVDRKGMPLAGTLAAGATVAPFKVERAGDVVLARLADGRDELGALEMLGSV